MDDENILFPNNANFASAATSTTCLTISEPFNSAQPILINFQLYIWEEALRIYSSLKNDDTTQIAERAFLLIEYLALSLSTLAGANHEGPGDTPPLLALYSGRLKNRRNEWFWNLNESSGKFENLHQDFKKLDEDHKDLIKHFSISKITKLSELGVNELTRHVQTAARVWNWILSNKPGGKDQAKIFEDYINLVDRQ